MQNQTKFRSSYLLEVFCKKGVLRNFANFTGKHLYQSLIFVKLAGLRPVTISKKRLWHRCFPFNFAKFLRIPIYIEHLRWLFLKIYSLLLFLANIWSHVFASYLHSFWTLSGVERYYAVWLLGMAPLYWVVLGTGILLGLVQ